MPQSVLAELDLLEGRPDAGRTRIVALLERFGPDFCDNAYRLPKLAWAQLELGDPAQAETAAARAVTFARNIDDFLNLVEAIRVRALVLMARQRWAEADSILAETLSETQRRHYPWGEARVLDTYGLLYTRAGKPALARQRLEVALGIFRRLGAHRDVARLEHDLARPASTASEYS